MCKSLTEEQSVDGHDLNLFFAAGSALCRLSISTFFYLFLFVIEIILYTFFTSWTQPTLDTLLKIKQFNFKKKKEVLTMTF